MPSNGSDPVVLDALIVGAGFGGVQQLKKLRDLGHKVRLVDAASDFGGVWYWNRYPGARVDTAVPTYELSEPELYQDWNWTQRFPGSAELRDYFRYVAKKWDLRKDCDFDTEVESAAWDEEQSRWDIKAKNGQIYQARFFLLNIGFAARRHMPDWNGIERFKGILIHPSYWPKEDIDLRGKKVAVIGTGATGVQIIQEVSQIASQLCVFQRTPNIACPMRQINFTNGEQEFPKEKYPEIFQKRLEGHSGFDFNIVDRLSTTESPTERLRTFEELWAKGDLRYAFANYKDTLVDLEANRAAYEFWKEKVRARLYGDPRLQELLAPETPPHPFACKRAALENGYYECFLKPSVHLVDVNETPVVEVTETGIKTTEREWDFDVIISATGFDAITGGIKQIDIRVGDQTLNDKWSQGTKTNLGLSAHGFPNFFYSYGPQSPCALSNGPSTSEIQSQWIVALLDDMKKRGYRRIEADRDVEERWAQLTSDLTNATLLIKAKSWYLGANIPGKRVEALNFPGGIPSYIKALEESRSNGWAGFHLK